MGYWQNLDCVNYLRNDDMECMGKKGQLGKSDIARFCDPFMALRPLVLFFVVYNL